MFFDLDIWHTAFLFFFDIIYPFFGFSKVKWLHLTGEVDKSVRFTCQIFSGFNVPKIIKIG